MLDFKLTCNLVRDESDQTSLLHPISVIATKKSTVKKEMKKKEESSPDSRKHQVQV